MIGTRILVATDGSDGGKAAEMYAAELATFIPDVSIIVMNVSPIQSTFRREALERAETGQGQTIVTEAMERIRAVVGDRVDLEGRSVPAMSPAEAIIREAEQESCGLIVLGSRGMGGFSRLLLGSVSSGVAQGAKCAVTIIPS